MHTRPVVVVTRRFPQAVEDRLAAGFDARTNPHDRAFTAAELIAAAQGADALLVTSSDKLDADFFAHLPQSVRVIATNSVGYEHIDLAAAAACGVPVTNTPDVLTDATADTAMLLLLGATRRATEGQALIRSGHWKGLRPTDLLGLQITGKVLGIVGMGRIGQAVAHRARAFGMTIHYCNRRELPPAQAQGAVFHAELESLLRVSPFLSMHAPSSPQTRHMLRAASIEWLPQGAVVVNTARGGLINDDDLIAALKSGRLGAAGLDVFENEPHLDPRYLDLPNAFLLPHMGSATVETRVAMGMLAVDNIQAVLAGRPALTPLRVN